MQNLRSFPTSWWSPEGCAVGNSLDAWGHWLGPKLILASLLMAVLSKVLGALMGTPGASCISSRSSRTCCGPAYQAAHLAALTLTATAMPLVAAGSQGDEMVPRFQEMHSQGQKIPVVELLGQDKGAVGLQQPEADHQQQEDDGHPHTHQNWLAGQ